MNAPVVTVVMPAYDAAPFVAEAVRSVLAQTFTDFELLVADDGSTDATVATARAAAGGDARVRVLEVAHGGPANARNAAIREARGRIVAFLDADDAWEPDHLTRLHAGLEAHPSRFVYSNATLFGDGPERPAHDVAYAPATSFADLYLTSHIPSPGAVAVRTDDVRAVGGFLEDAAFIGSEDRALYLSLAAKGVTPVYLPHRGVRYRVHPAQLSRRGAKQLRAKLAVRERFRDALDPVTRARLVPEPAADALLGRTAFDLAYAMLATDREAADAMLARALAYDPTIRDDGRRTRFATKRLRTQWVSLPDADALPPLSRLGGLLAGTWALATIAIYVVLRFEARRRGGS